MPRLSSLGVRIFLLAALAFTVALGASLVLIRAAAGRAADTTIERGLAATQAAIEDKLAARSAQLLATAQGLAGVSTYASRVEEALRAEDRGTLLDAAEEFRDQLGAKWTLLTDRNGLLVAWSDHPERMGNDLSGGALIALALGGAATEGVWAEPGDEGEVLYQAVGVPLRAPGSGQPFGVLVAAVPLDSTLAATLQRNTDSEVLFFVRGAAGHAAPTAGTLSISADLNRVLGSDTFSKRVALEAGGERWIGTVAPLRTAGGAPVGGVLGLRSRSDELAPYLRLQRTVMLALLGGLAIALLGAAWLARRISQPVAALVRATRQVSEGDFSPRLDTSASDEIGELSRAFQRMIGELEENRRLLEYVTAGGERRPANVATPGPEGPPPLEPGTILAGRYRLDELLGAGGMGVVYRAHDRKLDETIAVKILRPGLERTAPASLERFKQEIRLARRITHRHVVRIHDLGEEQGRYFITMELVEGTPVDALIRRRGRLPADVTLTIGKQLCRALEVAHEAGVIHRDIKPGNLVLDRGGQLKVMDFGIARLAEAQRPDQPGLTEVGTIVGSPDYMAPEQLLGEAVDHRADIYAVGCVLFECLVGRPVYEAQNLYALISRHLTAEVPDLRAVDPSVPEALAAVVSRALARAPDERWPSAAALRRALEGLA